MAKTKTEESFGQLLIRGAREALAYKRGELTAPPSEAHPAPPVIL